MLAKPNCLVALALYNNDFSKANQILEVCISNFDNIQINMHDTYIFTSKNSTYGWEFLDHLSHRVSYQITHNML